MDLDTNDDYRLVKGFNVDNLLAADPQYLEVALSVLADAGDSSKHMSVNHLGQLVIGSADYTFAPMALSSTGRSLTFVRVRG